MSLITQISTLATRVGTEFKTVYGKIGALPSLTTTAKSDLVSAINEVNAATAAAGAHIDDTSPSTTKVYSSSETETKISAAVNALINGAPGTLDTLNELATALLSDESGIAALNTAISNRLRTDAANTLTGTQQTQLRTDLGLGSASTHASTDFDPAGSAAAVTASSIGAATAAALSAEATTARAAEGAALQKTNNLSDLSNATTARSNLGLGSAATQASSAFDAAGAATAAQTAAVGSSLQKSANLGDVANAATSRTNLSVYSQSEIGDPTTDLAAVFTAALV